MSVRARLLRDPYCRYCGTPVDDLAYTPFGSRRVYYCDRFECLAAFDRDRRTPGAFDDPRTEPEDQPGAER